MVERRVNYGAWLFKLIAWDGLLPFVILLVPTVTDMVFAKRRGAIELAAVTVPIAAFFLRFFVGKRTIDLNQCKRWVQHIQLAALCIGILVLLMIDSLLILAHEMGRRALLATGEDLIVWFVLIAIYLTLMGFAMYPGRTEVLVDWRDFDPCPDSGPSVS